MLAMNMTIKTPEEYLKEPYTFLVIRDDDGTFAVEVQEFEGCFSQGETPDAAMANIFEAAKNWIEATIARGKPIPEPMALNEASGKFALRMPKHIHQKVQRLAQNDEVSVNTFLVEAIAEKIGAVEYHDRQMAHLERRMAQQTVANLAALFLPVPQQNPVFGRANTDRFSNEQPHGQNLVINVNQYKR